MAPTGKIENGFKYPPVSYFGGRREARPILSVLQVLSFEGTDDVYEILDEQIMYHPISDEGGRKLASCPNYNTNQCRRELRAVTRRSLTIAYSAMNFIATEKMANRVMDRFNDSHWCTMEDWFVPLIAARPLSVVTSRYYWSYGLMSQFCVLALATGFSATGFNSFMSIVADSHYWYESVAFSAMWAASVTAAIVTGGSSSIALIAMMVAKAGPQLQLDIINYVLCIAL